MRSLSGEKVQREEKKTFISALIHLNLMAQTLGRKERWWPHLYPSLELPKNGGDDRVLFSLLDLLPGRPDVVEIHLLPL